jgi:hypothetical protein
VLALPRLQLVDLTPEAKSEGLVEHARREFHQQIMLNLGGNSKVYYSSVLLLVEVGGSSPTNVEKIIEVGGSSPTFD